MALIPKSNYNLTIKAKLITLSMSTKRQISNAIFKCKSEDKIRKKLRTKKKPGRDE